MEISRTLLTPYFERLRNEFEDLDHALQLRVSVEVSELRLLVQQKIQEVDGFLTLLNKAEGIEKTALPNFQKGFRRLKLELRFAARKWRRFLSNETRIRKTQEKRFHASSFAA